jgi:RES domain-containing protein
VTLSLWRIASHTPDWSAEDMAGKGAAGKGARWNHPREHVTYAWTSISLAAWETRAHLGKAGVGLPFNRYLAARPLALGWDAIPEGRVSRSLGSAWLASARSALYVVPSVVIGEEDNVLINPAHVDSVHLTAAKVRRFLYDHRV